MKRLHVVRMGRPTMAERSQAAARVAALDELPEMRRPRTRGECQDGPRPCPWVGCRYHLLLDVTHAGSLRMCRDPDTESDADSCSLDVADRGVTTLESIGEILGVTREAVRLIETEATRKLGASILRDYK
jgi:hypothetical protein